MPYHSPHKFRHGHGVYALKLAKDVAALKAVSQNLMHASLSITDGVYGMLSTTDIKEQIAYPTEIKQKKLAIITSFLVWFLLNLAQHEMVKKWARLDSNQRPNDYESFALTAAPRALNSPPRHKWPKLA